MGLWFLAVGVGVAAGGLFGGVFQEFLRWVSVDHVYTDDSAILSASLRGGFLLGTVMAAGAVAGGRRPATMRRLLTVYLLLFAGVVLTTLAAGAVGVFLADQGWIAGSEPPLPVSRRFAFCNAVQIGSIVGACCSGCIALLCVFQGRKHTSSSQTNPGV